MLFALLALSMCSRRHHVSNARYGIVTSQNYLNIRSKPTKKSSSIGKMPGGSRFEILGESGDFWQINYQGIRGYAMKSYTREEGSGPNPPTPVPGPNPPTKGYYTVNQKEIVCRASASGGRILNRLYRGCVVQVTGTSGKKSSIKLAGGSEGYVDSSALSEGGSSSTIGPSSSSMGSELVRLVKTKIGCPYVYGASGPNSFDCAGLVRWAYRQCGVSIKAGTNLQMAEGRIIDTNAKIPGDAIYFGAKGETRSKHVALFIGGDAYIHAPYTGSTVQQSSLAGKTILTVRRFY